MDIPAVPWIDYRFMRIWRCQNAGANDERSLNIHQLQDNQYLTCDHSIALLPLQVNDITRFLELRFPLIPVP
ncbi:hypothetical protein J5X98_15915 [Leptothermofonsia sichuanensis E412]|uniref:hypothetical protein n=1 Tax=Leptothermofonsia sichuanensis TaxID=2917832 RepID=UPI001CA67545|nr:hypothetical protein [Leptothermofonsia sichuanensis]QZZ18929.1 hypothetical protein J5X98_15915 [Leptothermofonsia sichuanensis E412]